MKAAKLAAIQKMKSAFAKGKDKPKGECGCGMPGCKSCAKMGK